VSEYISRIDEDTLSFKDATSVPFPVSLVQEEARVNPLHFNYLSINETSTYFLLPPGYEVKTFPEDIQIDLPFIRYSRKYTLEGGQLYEESLCELKKLDIRTQEYPQFKALLEKIEEENQKGIILKKKA
jgi:hypothetical protein